MEGIFLVPSESQVVSVNNVRSYAKSSCLLRPLSVFALQVSQSRKNVSFSAVNTFNIYANLYFLE